ncbi:MAG: hypothetical protein AVDCRST_MAG11-1812, partial [uncultured Gemmatimonadaceae bacterium]
LRRVGERARGAGRVAGGPGARRPCGPGDGRRPDALAYAARDGRRARRRRAGRGARVHGAADPARAAPDQPLPEQRPGDEGQAAGARAGIGHDHLPAPEARGRAPQQHAEAALPRGDQEELRGVRRAGRPRRGREHGALSGCVERHPGERAEGVL